MISRRKSSLCADLSTFPDLHRVPITARISTTSGGKEPIAQPDTFGIMDRLKIILATDAIRPPLTGIGRYAFELAKGLASHPKVSDLKLQDRLRCYREPEALLKRHESITDMASKSGAPSSQLHGIQRSIWRSIAPSLKAARCWPHRDHIFHSPNYALPHFSGRCVSTVHDLSTCRHPEFHPLERVKHMRRVFPGILKRADLILTDSDFSRSEILDAFKLSSGRVKAIPLGVGPQYRPRTPEVLVEILARYGLNEGEYTLSVGTIEPRKNVERLIEAYRSLPLRLRSNLPLVLVGSEGWNSASIHARIAQGEHEGWLKYLAYIPEDDLQAIYAGARTFACVSIYEGFGLPVLEAMASGVAVLCSDAASLPEVGGDRVHYVDPLDLEAIRDGLMLLLEDDAERSRLARGGLERAAQFTWARTVEDTVAAYMTLA